MNKAHVVSYGSYSDWSIVAILIKQYVEIEGKFKRLYDDWIRDNPISSFDENDYLTAREYLEKFVQYMKDVHGYVEYKFEDHNYDD